MNTRNLRLAGWLVLLAGLGALGGCTNTVAGVGQDMQKGGSSLSDWATPEDQSVPPPPAYRPAQPPIQKQTPPSNDRYQFRVDAPIRLAGAGG